MRIFVRMALVLAILTAPYYLGLSGAGAATLWYNGDLDTGVGGYQNYALSLSSYCYVYDDFVVPAGERWSVTSVWSNNFMGSYTDTVGAYYEIRQGLSAGNAGTLVASGWGEWFQVASPTGRSYCGRTEYQITVDVSGVILTPGQYWLSVAPFNWGDNPTNSYISATTGANAVGNPPGNNGNAYWTDPNNNFVAFTAGDYSMGLAGDIVPFSTGCVPLLLLLD